MSHRGIAWAWEQPVASMAQRLVLLALAEQHGHKDDLCFPSLSTLCRMAKTSRRRLLQILADLEDADLIRIHSGGGRRSNRYELVGLTAATAVPPGELQAAGVEVPPVEPQGEICSSSTGVTAPVQFSSRSSSTGGTRTRASGISPGGDARVRAREAPPPDRDQLSSEEFIAGVDDAIRQELLAARPELEHHLECFLEKFAAKRAGTGHRPRDYWLSVLREWWETESAPDPATAAWESIRPQLSNWRRARTTDPNAAEAIRAMGGFSALGAMTEHQVDRQARPDFLQRYRAIQRAQRPDHPRPEIQTQAGAGR